jgi:hypothetical protein
VASHSGPITVSSTERTCSHTLDAVCLVGSEHALASSDDATTRVALTRSCFTPPESLPSTVAIARPHRASIRVLVPAMSILLGDVGCIKSASSIAVVYAACGSSASRLSGA